LVYGRFILLRIGFYLCYFLIVGLGYSDSDRCGVVDACFTPCMLAYFLGHSLLEYVVRKVSVLRVYPYSRLELNIMPYLSKSHESQTIHRYRTWLEVGEGYVQVQDERYNR